MLEAKRNQTEIDWTLTWLKWCTSYGRMESTSIRGIIKMYGKYESIIAQILETLFKIKEVWFQKLQNLESSTSYIIMFRWLNKQLRIYKFKKCCIHYQDIYGWICHDNKTWVKFYSNTYIWPILFFKALNDIKI